MDTTTAAPHTAVELSDVGGGRGIAPRNDLVHVLASTHRCLK